jgi:hypothetical protein
MHDPSKISHAVRDKKVEVEVEVEVHPQNPEFQL